MTEITVRLLPAPEAVGTLVIPGLAAGAAVEKLSAALGSPFGVSGAAWVPATAGLAGVEGPAALIRIEEFAESVAYRLGRLQALLGGDILDDAASRAVWAAVRDARPLAPGGDEAVWRVSVRPSAGPGVLAAIAAVDGRGFLDWGGGLVWIAGPATSEFHDCVTGAARAARGTWALVRAPEPMRASVAVIPPDPPALAAITARVKAAFDPLGILNPGRMHAGV
jgi:glycolate oxidase FAD binding subunit